MSKTCKTGDVCLQDYWAAGSSEGADEGGIYLHKKFFKFDSSAVAVARILMLVVTLQCNRG
jgi:hypothetical protein